jgi:hypothetical protein
MPELKSFYKKIIIALLALQIINLSIYNTEFFIHSNCLVHHGDQLKCQDPIDSFAELIMEHILNYKNAFPESNSKNTKQRGEEFKHNFNLKLFGTDNFSKLADQAEVRHTPSKKVFSHYRNTYSFLYFKEIKNPPV